MAEHDDEVLPDPQEFTDPSPDPDGDGDLAVLCDLLQERGVTRVDVCYQGGGDEETVEDVEFEPADAFLPDWVEGRLRDVAAGYWPDGYAAGDGGHGTLTVYPYDGLAELRHHDRYEDVESLDVRAAPLPRGLRRRLARLGVRRVVARFDGYGDSGQLGEFAVEPGAAELDAALEEELADFLLEQLPGGWEINEGSFGEFAVDVGSGRVAADASWRVEKDAEPEVTRWRWRP
jgi:hypothetical protein